MFIKLSDLDTSIYSQIPLSIRLNTDVVELEKLPFEIQYLITKNLNKPEIDVYRPSNIYDTQFTVNIYNDMESFQSKKKAVIYYIKNYILTAKGKYPFDPEFGNNLKKYLQTKDTVLRQKLLASELDVMINLVNTSFNVSIKVINAQLLPYNYGDHVEYLLQIKINIENEDVTFQVT
jgi:hypothetical protein